jgi:adenylyltransferase and sulfurtransferase
MNSLPPKKALIERYSRQILVPGIGLNGQLAFEKSCVLVVGCGGLGCPVILYLASAGVGHLRVCDADAVEVSNLHRQIMHREAASISGMNKARSVVQGCAEISKSVRVEAVEELVTSENVLGLMEGVDVVVDATDNVVTRYLLNDAACIKRIPLVSGAALGWQGQLSVYPFSDTSSDYPCYRCLYPNPPPVGAVTNCDLGGVVGPVTGVIGSLQALQVLRILAKLQPACADSLLTFGADDPGRLFRQLRIRKRNPKCIACGDQGPTEIFDPLHNTLKLNYSQFCNNQSPDDKNPSLDILLEAQRITCRELAALQKDLNHEKLVIIDVRPQNQIEFGSIHGAHFIPYDQFHHPETREKILNLTRKAQEIVFICRRGNDSQLAAKHFINILPNVRVRDLIGGMRSWATIIDENMPIY